jgi:hypothetical protein
MFFLRACSQFNELRPCWDPPSSRLLSASALSDKQLANIALRWKKVCHASYAELQN